MGYSIKYLASGLFLLFLLFINACTSRAPRTVSFESIPKIDLHAHIFPDIPEFVDWVSINKLKLMNIAVAGTDPIKLLYMDKQSRLLMQKYPRQFAYCTTFDLTGIRDARYVENVKTWLDSAFVHGASMVKIWKEIGMEIKDKEGNYILPDDPLFDPIYDHISKNKKVLIAHLADPKEAWEPLDSNNVYYNYYQNNKQWHFFGKLGVPSYEAIILAMENILTKHPALTFVGAHLCNLSHDIDEIARRLDRFPNLYIENSARTAYLARQPTEKVRNFILKYQDRFLYGSDYAINYNNEDGEYLYSYKKPDDIRQAVDFADTVYRRDFGYFANSGPYLYLRFKTEALNLPKPVLEKIFFKNAQKIIFKTAL